MTRIQTLTLYAAEGDKGSEQPTGKMLGLVAIDPNSMVHDRTEDVLRQINACLRVDIEGNLIPEPLYDWEHLKLVRYTAEQYIYDATRPNYTTRKADSTPTVTQRYILKRP